MVKDIEEKPNPKLRFEFEAAQTLLKAPIQIQLSDQQHIYMHKIQVWAKYQCLI